MTKRIFDLVFAFAGLMLLSPLLLIVAIFIISGSRGGVIYRQLRVGKNGKPFMIYKFRTMIPDADKQGLLSKGDADSRITGVGKVLRKYKIDELPQFFNILKGDMSFVGPRPEVPKYVAFYTQTQKRTLSVRPGLTDPASIKYVNEGELLAHTESPEHLYLNKIMPDKLALNLEYIQNQSLVYDIGIIFATIKKLFRFS